MRTHLIRVTAQELKQLLDKLVEPTHNVFALAAVNKGSVHPLLTFVKIVSGPSATSGNRLCSQIMMPIQFPQFRGVRNQLAVLRAVPGHLELLILYHRCGQL